MECSKILEQRYFINHEWFLFDFFPAAMII